MVRTIQDINDSPIRRVHETTGKNHSPLYGKPMGQERQYHEIVHSTVHGKASGGIEESKAGYENKDVSVLLGNPPQRPGVKPSKQEHDLSGLKVHDTQKAHQEGHYSKKPHNDHCRPLSGRPGFLRGIR